MVSEFWRDALLGMLIMTAVAADSHAQGLIDSARRHLAAADSQLQLSLQLMDR